jgi:phosphoglycolate phosphatase-like HAD superfamily hydrolase
MDTVMERVTQPAVEVPYFKNGLDVGIDIDGVLVNNVHVWNEYFDKNAEAHGHDPKTIPYDQAPHWDYHANICKDCFKECLFNHDIVGSYELVPEAKEILYWFKHLGIRNHLITSRPKEVEELTHVWGRKQFGDIIETINVTNNKLEVASALHCRYHIEDNEGHIRAFQTQKEIIPIIWSAPYNLTLEGARVRSWPEVATYILWKEAQRK